MLYLLSVVANTEPKQVYDGKPSFVSERTIKEIIIVPVMDGGSRAAPVLHGLRITTRFHASPPTRGGVAFYMAKTFPGL